MTVGGSLWRVASGRRVLPAHSHGPHGSRCDEQIAWKPRRKRERFLPGVQTESDRTAAELPHVADHPEAGARSRAVGEITAANSFLSPFQVSVVYIRRTYK